MHEFSCLLQQPELQMHHSDSDQPLGNAPGRAPVAETERNAIVLMSSLQKAYSVVLTGKSNPAKSGAGATFLSPSPAPQDWTTHLSSNDTC